MEEQNHKPHPLATRKRPVLGRIKTINLEILLKRPINMKDSQQMGIISESLLYCHKFATYFFQRKVHSNLYLISFLGDFL